MTTLFSKWLLITVVSMGAVPILFAQDKGRLEGRINDEQNRPLASATVTLVDLYGIVASKITFPDSSGRFSIEDIPDGLFTCKITHAGYQPITRDSIVFTSTSGAIDLGDLTMVPDRK